MTRIAEILAVKGSQVWSVTPETTVYQAIERMVQHNVGSLLVAEGDAIAGIFTERDFLSRVALQDRSAKTTRVREAMTERVCCVEPTKSVEECMAIMTQQRIRHLPVVDQERVVGMISIGDLVKHVSKEQEVEIRHLTNYITGSL
jgi:CBS domain-containing protein